MTGPDNQSDYKDSYINGGLEHPFGLPGVDCDICGSTWGGSRILAYECPINLRDQKYIIDRWPISRKEHEVLQKNLMQELSIQGAPFSVLRPGDSFQPSYLDVPSRPTSDFLWSSLGSLVVSERIKGVLSKECQDEISVCAVNLRKVGERDLSLEPPMPSTGEPEDIIEEVPLSRTPSSYGPYFEILINNESELPDGVNDLSICPGCQRPNFDGSKRQLRMKADMWKGHKLFFLATTLCIIATDDLKKKLVELKPTNVTFIEI
jgi:hypothetical protein